MCNKLRRLNITVTAAPSSVSEPHFSFVLKPVKTLTWRVEMLALGKVVPVWSML